MYSISSTLLVSFALTVGFNTSGFGGTPPTVVLERHPINLASALATGTSSVLVRVSQGDTSQSAEKVEALQRALQAAGYYLNCKIDGWYGPFTGQAIMEFQRDNGLEVTGMTDEALYQKVLAKAKASAATSSQASVPAGFSAYLKSSSGTPSNNSRIMAQAKKLTGKTPLETTQNIFNFVGKVKYQFYMNTRKGALGVLSSMQGNCVDQAHLVVSLLRASGIPAQYGHSTDCRFNSGLRTGHVWAYAYINGTWLPLDTTSSRNRVGQLNSFRQIVPATKKVEVSF